MKPIIEKIGLLALEAIPTLAVIGIVVYIIFGGPMADFMEIFARWLYG